MTVQVEAAALDVEFAEGDMTLGGVMAEAEAHVYGVPREAPSTTEPKDEILEIFVDHDRIDSMIEWAMLYREPL